MQTHYEVAIVTLVALLVYVWMGLRVGAARGKSGIAAPAMSGDPLLERTLRVQGNTLEWLPIFLPSLWIFALYWNDRVAALVGLVWIVGRILYALGYWKEASKRELGFTIQALAAAVLLFGGLGRVIWAMVTTGTY
ncbi:MAG TPA: MAPEG family protein [Phenylobacterium sp.]|nr:MAPEG family protein [Phenylobacterium sp.]